MYRVLAVIVVLAGVSIIAVVFLSKTEEVQESPQISEVKEIIQEKATSSPALTPKIVSKPINRQSPLPGQIDIPPIVSVSPVVPKPVLPQSPLTAPESAPAPATTEVQVPKLPPAPTVASEPLDKKILLDAVVKIQCPMADGLGKYIGSGFAIGGRTIITAAHVIKDSASDTCEVIFPRERKPIHYLKGTIVNLKETIRRHDEEGIDIGILILPELSSYPEARAIFSNPSGTGGASYPSISYPICNSPRVLGDKLLHFGYPSNYVDQTYLSELPGEAVVHAEIKSIENRLSLDGTYSYKSPIFDFTYDESKMHPYMVSRVASFYGDSGGLAFNADKQCIIGPHRGGTIGKAAGENYSVFMNLGWEKARPLLP